MCINRYRYNCMCELRIIMKLYPTIRNCFANCILILKFHLVMNLILRETNNFIRLLSRDDSFFSFTFMLYFFVSVFISIYIRHMPSYISYPVPLTFHFSKPKEKERGGDWILFQSNLSAMHARILYPQSWNSLPVCLCLGSVLHFTNCTKLFFYPLRHGKQMNIYPATDLINVLKCYATTCP